MKKLESGHRAEDIASDYLEELGYKKLDQNHYFTTGEIDLVFKDGEFIVFVEVKSLGANSPFSIYETLSKSKKRRIRMTINSWISKNNKYKEIWRFDFVGVIMGRDGVESVEHFRFVEL